MNTATVHIIAWLIQTGVSAFNNWRDGKPKELKIKQQEYDIQKDSLDNEQRWKILQNNHTFALEKQEADLQYRIQEIKDHCDNFVKNIIDEYAIKEWPLKVLPIVMLQQNFGSFFMPHTSSKVDPKNTENSDADFKNLHKAFHCILTPMDNAIEGKEFFKYYKHIETELQFFFNNYWNIDSNHNVVFYSGAWEKETVNNNHISAIFEHTKYLPLVIITPHITENGELEFKVYHSKDTKCYISKLPVKINSGNIKDNITYISNYLKCLIASLADFHFLQKYDELPLLPSLVEKGRLYLPESLQNICCENYYLLLDSYINIIKKTGLDYTNLFLVFEKCIPFFDKQKKFDLFENICLEFCDFITGIKYNKISSAVKAYFRLDKSQSDYSIKIGGITVSGIGEIIQMMEQRELTNEFYIDICQGIVSGELINWVKKYKIDYPKIRNYHPIHD